jgi:hypothetical protein
MQANKWMIENVFEALDFPNEWWFDPSESKLYLIPNATIPDDRADTSSGQLLDHAPPPADTTYVAVQLETLISINGTKDAPVKDITVQGITLRDAADITMNPWGVPSGGGACSTSCWPAGHMLTMHCC